MYNNYEERIELLNKQLVSEYKKNDKLQQENHKLQQEDKQLKEIIDKAIEYIENETERYGLGISPNMIIKGTWLYYLLEVLKVLKGESNE